jgi:hypothetical protein
MAASRYSGVDRIDMRTMDDENAASEEQRLSSDRARELLREHGISGDEWWLECEDGWPKEAVRPTLEEAAPLRHADPIASFEAIAEQAESEFAAISRKAASPCVQRDHARRRVGRGRPPARRVARTAARGKSPPDDPDEPEPLARRLAPDDKLIWALAVAHARFLADLLRRRAA